MSLKRVFAAAVGTAIGAVGVAAPAVADTTRQFVGSITTWGAVVGVDFGPWQGPIALGRDTSSPARGIDLLTDTGFTTAGNQQHGPGFLCRIGSKLFANGTQYPTPTQGPCIVTPPATAYWSYWLAPAGQATWTYSPLGATGQTACTPQQLRDQETAGTGSGGSGGGSGNGTTAGGSIGNEALLTEVLGRDPHRVRGRNLGAALDKLICSRTDKHGCVGGAGSYAYGASTFDQALRIIAQLRAGDAKRAAPTIGDLERHQHLSGAWPSLLPSSGDSDVDSAAMAAMALALREHDAKVSASVLRALAWITHRQKRDGGFNIAAGGPRRSDVRASTQLVGGLVGTSLGTLRSRRAQAHR